MRNYRRHKKYVSAILCATMLFGGIPFMSTSATAGLKETVQTETVQRNSEDETTSVAQTEGTFVLAASTINENIIVPVRITYGSGDTILTALQKSGYKFERNPGNQFIIKIQGVEGNFCIYCSDGGYDLERSPEGINVVEFTELTEKSDSRTKLLQRMVEYQEMTNNVQHYQAAADAYSDALKQYKSVNESTAAILLQKLNDAITAYENILNQETHTLTVNATQNGVQNNNLSMEFFDVYGNTYQAEGNTIHLRAGDYYYWISDGKYNYCSNDFSKQLKVADSEATLDITLPSGEWFDDVYLLQNRTDNNGKKIPFRYETDVTNHMVECFVDDRAGGKNSVFLYVTPGKDLPEDLKNYDVRFYLNDEHSLADSGVGVSWNSEKNDYGMYRISPGMEGSQYDIKTRYLGESDNRTSILFQTYAVKVTRIPTAEIMIKAQNGNALLEGFDPADTEYNVDTVSDTIIVDAVTFGKEGYSVTINNDGTEVSDGKIKLHEGENKVAVIVSHTNGQSRTYRFTVNKKHAVQTNVKASSGVKVQVFNFNDEEVKPVNGGYLLVPGSTYTYVTSINDTYFAKESFTISESQDQTVTVLAADPEQKDALAAYGLYNASSAKNRITFESNNKFTANMHQYSYVIPDANTSIFTQATPISGYKVKAVWKNQSDGKSAERSSINEVSEKKAATVLSRVLESSAYGNQVTLVTYKEDQGVTYYQNYVLNIRRSLHMKNLSVSTIAGNVVFTDKEGNAQTFDRDVLNYNLVIASGIDGLTLSGHFVNEGTVKAYDGGYYALINGKRYTDLSEVSVALDNSKKEEIIPIEICNEKTDAVSSKYTLTVKKRDMASVTFRTNPEDANVFVQNELDHSTVYSDMSGHYKLMPEVPYTYTVTRKGYKAVQKTGFIVEKNELVTVNLEKAEENTSVKELPSQWPSFRDENNNVVLNEKTPIKAEDSVLYWANNECFDGYCGHPILVNGYLYTYDSKNLLKLDTVTGELVQKGDSLVRASSFSIQPPTYGGGMIFVGLSQGTIQAFNADTMESLWVYKDPLGGQPNCQITYKDGYIYTGFWNNETMEANYVCISTTDENPIFGTEAKKATWTHTQKGGYYWAGSYIEENGKFMLEGTDDGEAGYTKGYAHVLSMNPKTGEVIDDLTLPHPGDLRSNITHDTVGTNATGDYYFTTKGGYFYRISVDTDGRFDRNSLRWIKLDNGRNNNTAMSTSTPTVYNGRAYVGVSGESQFGQYTGHRIAVLDLISMSAAYYVPTQGYPQTSGILSRGYESETGKVYVYFFDNFTPGKLRVISDQPGQTAMAEKTEEQLYGNVFDTGYVLFTPSGAQAQYALCNPIVDEYGTLYFRNDSNFMMAFGSSITKLEVTKQPDKVDYKENDIFNPAGMEVMATYANGLTRDVTKYVSYSNERLSMDDTDFVITFEHVKYQNKDGVTGLDYTAPIAHLSLNITSDSVNGVSVSGQIRSWDSENNARVYLYDGSVSDEDIRTDMRNEIPELAENCVAVMGAIGEKREGEYFEQTYQFTNVNAGNYKIAIEKKGKYVVSVISILVEQSDVTVDAQIMWLYGDVNGDGIVDSKDITQILRYISNKSSVVSTDSEDIFYRKYAANVTALSENDSIIDSKDATQILRYISNKTSVFDCVN